MKSKPHDQVESKKKLLEELEKIQKKKEEALAKAEEIKFFFLYNTFT
jgi:hypothetical protein